MCKEKTLTGLVDITHKDVYIICSKLLENRKIWIELMWDKAIDRVEKISNIQRKGIALKLFGPKKFMTREEVRKRLKESNYTNDYFYYRHRPYLDGYNWVSNKASDLLQVSKFIKDQDKIMQIEASLLANIMRLQKLENFYVDGSYVASDEDMGR